MNVLISRRSCGVCSGYQELYLDIKLKEDGTYQYEVREAHADDDKLFHIEEGAVKRSIAKRAVRKAIQSFVRDIEKAQARLDLALEALKHFR